MTDSKKSILPDDINWDHLKRFKICAESKNFKEAAAKIGTSTTALSHQIDTIEIELGYKLFELVNHNRTLKLTDQGTHLFQMVSMAHLYLNGSRSLMSNQIAQEESLPKIKVISTPGLVDTLLSKIVDTFLNKYPHYQIEAIASGPPIKITDEEIVIRGDIKNQKDIVKEPLFDMHMNLYASEEYIEKMGRPLKQEDLQDHKILAFQAINYGSSGGVLSRTKGFYVEPTILSNSVHFLHDMCCAGYGIVELPHTYPLNPKLVRVLENIEGQKFTMSLGFHKNSLYKSGTSQFINFILNNCHNFLSSS